MIFWAFLRLPLLELLVSIYKHYIIISSYFSSFLMFLKIMLNEISFLNFTHQGLITHRGTFIYEAHFWTGSVQLYSAPVFLNLFYILGKCDSYTFITHNIDLSTQRRNDTILRFIVFKIICLKNPSIYCCDRDNVLLWDCL